MSRWFTSFQFIAHLRHARRWDSFHSPYLFDLFTYCCNVKNGSPIFRKIENYRRILLASKEENTRLDYGAGSSANSYDRTITVSEIAKNALSHPFQCRFLFRMAAFLKPHSTLEFGTSLGISTAYLSAGCPTGRIDTVEGDPNVAAVAQNTFKALGNLNINLYTSTFQDFIDIHLDQKGQIDLLFLDGHHTSKALLHYFQQLKHKFNADTVVVVDDIYWSKDMNDGWNELAKYPEVTQSVDCFHFGLLFFKSDFIGQGNHRVRLPWKMMLAKV